MNDKEFWHLVAITPKLGVLAHSEEEETQLKRRISSEVAYATCYNIMMRMQNPDLEKWAWLYTAAEVEDYPAQIMKAANVAG